MLPELRGLSALPRPLLPMGFTSWESGAGFVWVQGPLGGTLQLLHARLRAPGVGDTPGVIPIPSPRLRDGTEHPGAPLLTPRLLFQMLAQLKNNPWFKKTKKPNSPDADVHNWTPLGGFASPKPLLAPLCRSFLPRWETTDPFIFLRICQTRSGWLTSIPPHRAISGPDPAPGSRERCHLG